MFWVAALVEIGLAFISSEILGDDQVKCLSLPHVDSMRLTKHYDPTGTQLPPPHPHR